MKDLLGNFIEKARHDLDTAVKILNERSEHTDIITYHCQQTIEKILKAFLIYHHVKIKTNHDIAELLMECIAIRGDFIRFRTDVFYRLDEIGVSVRYTDIEDDPGREETVKFVSLASECYDTITGMIGNGSTQ